MNMYVLEAIIYGIVQGLTEFLPISSSAHLGLVAKIFNWTEQPLSFDLLIHIASLLALLIYFKKDIHSIFKGFYSDQITKTISKRLIFNLIISLIPLIPFYIIFKQQIKSSQAFSNISLILLIIFGILLIIADKIGKGNKKKIEAISIKDSISIGLAQCLSLFSGVSRSGVTITAGLLRGIDKNDSKKYSFLLAIPTILGAFIAEILFLDGNPVIIDLPTMIGFIASFFSALLALKILFRFGETIKLSHYGIYRVVLGIILLIIL